LYLVTFDTNNNLYISSKLLNILAIIKHNSLLYILIYKQKYRLHNKDANNKVLISNINFYIINLNNKVLNLIIDKKYILTKFVLILLIAKKFLRKYI